jgi:hypothetical protein
MPLEAPVTIALLPGQNGEHFAIESAIVGIFRNTAGVQLNPARIP